MYAIVKELIKVGVIYEDIGTSTTYLLARPPQQLRIIVDKEKVQLQQKEQAVTAAVQELEAITKNTRYSIPRITFINEDQLEKYLYARTPVWNESILKTDGTWWGFQDHHFVQHYETWIDWYWEHATPKINSLKLLSNQSAEQLKKKKFPERHIRFWEYSQDFTATTWVNGDYLVMIRCDQRPHYLVEIHDAVLAHNMRQVFKGIWQGGN